MLIYVFYYHVLSLLRKKTWKKYRWNPLLFVPPQLDLNDDIIFVFQLFSQLYTNSMFV